MNNTIKTLNQFIEDNNVVAFLGIDLSDGELLGAWTIQSHNEFFIDITFGYSYHLDNLEWDGKILKGDLFDGETKIDVVTLKPLYL